MTGRPRGLARHTIRFVASMVAYAALLFGSAGTLDWPAAWVYLAITVAVILGYAVVISTKHPDLIEERTRPPADAKRWDKPLVALIAVVGPLAMILAAGLERRSHGSPPGFTPAVLAGLLLVGAGGAFTNWAVAANRFFSAVVRIQRDRGHSVVDTGPYRVVRHPGYLGATANNIGTALALSTRWGLTVALLVALLLVVRTAKEDATLRRELDGYEDYTRRVRWRLLPGAW